MTFVQFCELHGLVMGPLVEGRWKRVKTIDKPQHRNGAYKYLGDHGFVQNHATMSEVAVWRSESPSAAKPLDTARLEAQRARDRDYRRRAIVGARAYWANSKPLRAPHPYIAKKGLGALGCAGLREHDGLLVVPVMWGDRLTSVQTIDADGNKRFWPGAPVDAGAYRLTRPGAAVTVFAEGLSTSLAVFQAVRMASVVCCFNAGNILKVVQHAKPAGSVVICADNDHGTEARRGFNPGIQAATAAAELIGAGVWWPEGIEGTDAADFLAQVGEGAARKLERQILAKAQYVMEETR